MIGIYKIENKENKLVYIGQSVNIERRWKDHRNKAFNSNSKDYSIPLYKDFRKYGLDKFKFEILEECLKEELNVKEQYWIEYYNSFFNGYNESFGGNTHCRHTNISKDKIIGVITDLKTTNMKHKEIAEKWNISTEMVQGINTGRYWNHNVSYPIQKKNISENKCSVCGKTISKGATFCKECYLIKKHKNIPSKNELEKNIKEFSFVQLGKMYGVSGNAVRKWCKSYDLPYKKTDIKILTN